VVACREETQIVRLCARLGIDPAEARRQIAAQWPLAEKLARADETVMTDDDLENTLRQVKALWDQLAQD
jgi:dephospho-CoA kinase